MRLFLVILLLMLTATLPAYAEHVLPYPSYMPGNRLYKVSRIIDTLNEYWYWGNIARAKYHQSLSDKYLIEAKTLFEYKQYPLALDALTRSDEQYKKGKPEVSQAHIDVLTKLIALVPDSFVWEDEHKAPVTLDLSGQLERSLEIRNE